MVLMSLFWCHSPAKEMMRISSLAFVALVGLGAPLLGQETFRTGYVNQYHTCRGWGRARIRPISGNDDRMSVVLLEVDSLSPAGRAGLREGDELVSMNGVDQTHFLPPGTVAYRDSTGAANVLRVRDAHGEREIRF